MIQVEDIQKKIEAVMNEKGLRYAAALLALSGAYKTESVNCVI